MAQAQPSSELRRIGVLSPTSLSEAERQLISMTFGPAMACCGRRPQVRAPQREFQNS